MLNSVCLLPTALSEIAEQSSRTGVLTLSDRYGLMAALLDESLSEEECQFIDRLVFAVRRGRLTLE
jgi:hypothetical protein